MLRREGDDRSASLAHCRRMNNESPQREGQEPQMHNRKMIFGAALVVAGVAPAGYRSFGP